MAFNKKGFTLTELIVTIVILAMGMIFIVNLIITMAESIAWDRERHELSDTSRRAFEQMVYEIQNVRDEGAILSAQRRSFYFRNRQGNLRRIYVMQDTTDPTIFTLRLQMGTVHYPLSDYAENINTLTFTYYDRDGVAMNSDASPNVAAADYDKIRTIRFEVMFVHPKYPLQRFKLNTEVQPKNISDHENFEV